MPVLCSASWDGPPLTHTNLHQNKTKLTHTTHTQTITSSTNTYTMRVIPVVVNHRTLRCRCCVARVGMGCRSHTHKLTSKQNKTDSQNTLALTHLHHEGHPSCCQSQDTAMTVLCSASWDGLLLTHTNLHQNTTKLTHTTHTQTITSSTNTYTMRVIPVVVNHRTLRCRCCVARVGMGRLASAVGSPLLARPVNELSGRVTRHACA